MLELARHPEHIAKLREELAPYMPDPTDNVLHQAIAHLDHLNGIIYECLRLYPPLPTAAERLTPAEGVDIGGTHIPGNVTVWCPQYAIGRSESDMNEDQSASPKILTPWDRRRHLHACL